MVVRSCCLESCLGRSDAVRTRHLVASIWNHKSRSHLFPNHDMIPLFNGPEQKRRSINLGGVSSASSHGDVLQNARAFRAERQALKRQRDAAVQVQAWWRGCMVSRQIRTQLRARFDEDVRSLDAMRCLVILGRDEDRLTRWAEAVVEMDEGALPYAFHYSA